MKSAVAVFTGMSGRGDTRTVVQREGQTGSWAALQAEQLLVRWETEYAEQDLYTRTPIHLGFSKAFSAHFTKAQGRAEMNFQTGRVAVSVDGLEPLQEGSAYEVWLVDNVPGVRNTAAIDLGEDGDGILNLGTLPAAGTLVTWVGAEKLARVDVDMAAVGHVAGERAAETRRGADRPTWPSRARVRQAFHSHSARMGTA